MQSVSTQPPLSAWRNATRHWRSVVLATLLPVLYPGVMIQARAASSPTVVAKWSRFEHEFRSSLTYEYPLQEATLTVVFTSPLGEKKTVYGFWDGGKVWRVRFAPDQAGRWTFQSRCSDPRNRGLEGQRGEFICTAITGENRFRRHGPVQVSRDHCHLVHADGTPFFWLADTVWDGPRLAAPKEWELYAQVRSAQNFTVAQWSVAPGLDSKQQSAITGFADRIGVNPEFFNRLEAKLQTLSQAGILSAIVPFAEVERHKESGLPLPDEQVGLLLRYVMARWQAEPVVWLLTFEGDTQAKKVGRWKRIGQFAFGQTAHAPVILYPGETPWLLDEFRDQSWVDVFGFPTLRDGSEDGVKWLVAGPMVKEWAKEPTRPLIPFTPLENSVSPRSKKRFSAEDVRHAAYWGLLQSAPAGVSYGSQGVATWDTTTELKKEQTPGASLPLWQKSLFLPGAKQMSLLAKTLSSVEFMRLHPEPKLVAAQPGDSAPAQYVSAVGTDEKDLALVYVPGSRTLVLAQEALPPSPTLTWFNPRTGQTSPATATKADRTVQLSTPEAGDWLLIIRR